MSTLLTPEEIEDVIVQKDRFNPIERVARMQLHKVILEIDAIRGEGDKSIRRFCSKVEAWSEAAKKEIG